MLGTIAGITEAQRHRGAFGPGSVPLCLCGESLLGDMRGFMESIA